MSSATILTKDHSMLTPQRKSLAAYLALAAVIAFAFFLHFYNLDQEGFSNLYYAATVKSMLMSWQNFFFAAYDPAGFVTVDKPPLGFWVQALSATILGFNGFALLLPQALAGVLSVLLLYHLVARVFGAWAGIIAALVLTVTPISVAANRNNTMDSQLVLTSLLAAWAVSLAVEKGKLRWLLLCALFVGIGFNIKMLQAVMVLPAFWLVYLVAAKTAWWKRILHLTLATILLAVISFSWVVIVDSTPADERPFVGSSKNNTEMELIVGHNGLTRLGQIANWVGLRGPAPARAANAPQANNPQSNQPRPQTPPGGQPQYPSPQNQPGTQPQYPPLYGQPRPNQPNNPPTYGPPPQNQSGSQPQYPPMYGQPPQNQPGQPNLMPGQYPQNQTPGQNSETGDPGLFRLFNQQLVGQASWLVPLALWSMIIGAFVAFINHELRFTLYALLLWATWLIPQLVFFSFAGLFHRYYLEMMSPAIAALVGIGLAEMWNLFRQHKWRGLVLPLAFTGTAIAQAVMLSNFPEWSRSLSPFILGITILGSLLLILLRTRLKSSLLAFSFCLLALLIAPTIWSFTPVASVGDSGLPFAGPELLNRRGNGHGIQTTNPLIDYLRRNRNGAKFLVATTSAQIASPIILATGEPVMAMGGFGGNDTILTTSQLAQFVTDNTVRFFWLPQDNNQQAELGRWVRQNCSLVQLPGQQNQRPGQNAPPQQPGINAQQLYQCANAK